MCKPKNWRMHNFLHIWLKRKKNWNKWDFKQTTLSLSLSFVNKFQIFCIFHGYSSLPPTVSALNWECKCVVDILLQKSMLSARHRSKSSSSHKTTTAFCREDTPNSIRKSFAYLILTCLCGTCSCEPSINYVYDCGLHLNQYRESH